MGNNNIVKMLFLITQIGITMLTAIFMCLGIGYVVDRAFGTHLMAWFIVLGVLAGFKSVSLLLRKFIGDYKGQNTDLFEGSNSPKESYEGQDKEFDDEDDI